MKLHLYILPAQGNGNTEGAKKALQSFGDIVMQVTHGIRSNQLWMTAVHYADWYGYIFDDEYLDDRLQQALKIMIHHEQVDYFVLFKKQIVNGQRKITTAPRIFRSHVALHKGLLNPVNTGRLVSEKILDGWIQG